MWQNRVANKATAEFTQVKMCSSHRRQAISFGSLSYTNRTKERNPFIDFSTLVGWAMVQTDKQTEHTIQRGSKRWSRKGGSGGYKCGSGGWVTEITKAAF